MEADNSIDLLQKRGPFSVGNTIEFIHCFKGIANLAAYGMGILTLICLDTPEFIHLKRSPKRV